MRWGQGCCQNLKGGGGRAEYWPFPLVRSLAILPPPHPQYKITTNGEKAQSNLPFFTNHISCSNWNLKAPFDFNFRMILNSSLSGGIKLLYSIFNHLTQARCRGLRRTPQSAKRSTFSHKMGQKRGFLYEG